MKHTFNLGKHMRLFASIFTFLTACVGSSDIKSKPSGNITPAKSFYDFKMKSLDGEWIDFSKYKGKKVLIVNTASECGYTPQYEKLQKLHEQYGGKVVVLGFPANNFGAQEPGSNTDIKQFCSKNYGVTFQMFEKISVSGEDMHPLYKWLSTKSENGWNDQAPKWNFNKYLINENGELIKYYPSNVDPLSTEITNELSK
jgi:glutathione peroxidase